jgi:hypothetical protein
MLFEELMNDKPPQGRPERAVPGLKRATKGGGVKGMHSSSVSARTFRITMVTIGAVFVISLLGAIVWGVSLAFQIYLG